MPPDEALRLPGETLQEIDFLPLAGLAGPEADLLVAQTSVHLEVPCRLIEPPPGLEMPVIPGRDQVDADRLLSRIEALERRPGLALVGLTGRDLAIPIFTFVFGRARVGGRAAVVSLARLRPEHYGLPSDPALTVRRGVAEILHELGHVAGLGHCQDFQCLMHFSTDIEAADLRPLTCCESCAAELPAGLFVTSRIAAVS
jgi:archaemetzincin